MCAAADFFHGDTPDLEAIFNGDYSGFMAWRERHTANTVLPDAERVQSQFSNVKGQGRASRSKDIVVCGYDCCGMSSRKADRLA